MIPQKNIEEIFESAKIEDVVGEFVNLRKRGVNLIGLCPFHNEKTPSFTVSPAKNIFKCFGCGQGGGPTHFLMEHENLSFPDALRYLAKKYNIEIEEIERTPEAVQQQQEMDSLYIINEYAREFYKDQLLHTDEGKSIGLSYFKQRGFREETIKKFGLGFAPARKDRFTQKAVQDGYNIELLRRLGLTTSYDKDFFRDRVMFSIHNLSGKVLGFAGRILQKNVKAPKYINSPETEIYNKSKVLYGAYFAKQAIRKAEECILVEGYTDVISLHQAGIENVVASSGTSLTVEQIRLIKRYTPNVKILYDGDTAGVSAALRGLDLVLEQDLNVKVVLLPQGEDPDSYLQQVGVTAFKSYLENEAKDFIFFKTELLLNETASDPVKKTRVIKDIIASIAKIPDPLKRSLYIKECARLVGLEENVLVRETNKVVSSIIQQRRDNNLRTAERNAPSSAGTAEHEQPVNNRPQSREEVYTDEYQEKDIIRLLINYGHEWFEEEENMTVAEFLLGNIEEVIDDFDHALYGEIAREYLQHLLNESLPTREHFINHAKPEIATLAVDLISSPYDYSPGWEEKEMFLQTQKMPDENFTRDSIQAMLRFKLKKIGKTIDLNLKRIQQAEEAKDVEKTTTLIKVHGKLLQTRSEIARQLNTVVLK